MKEQLHLEITWLTLWRVIVFAALVIMFYLARDVVGVLLVAMVVSLGIDPMVTFLERFRIPRILGTFFIFLLAVGSLGILVYFIIPIVLDQIGAFILSLNKMLSSFLGVGLPNATVKNFSLGVDKAVGFLTAANISIPGAITAIFSNVILVFTTMVSAFYLTVERNGPERFLRVVIPDAYESSVLTVFSRFQIKIRRWFTAQLGLSIIVGGLVTVALTFLGVKYPLAIGFLAAVFELVPIMGPIITGVVAFIIAVADSTSLGVWVVLIFFGIQQFENHVLIPLVMGRAMKVHPVVVILALIAGGEVAGLLGMILSVPVAVLGQEIFTYLAERKSGRRTVEEV